MARSGLKIVRVNWDDAAAHAAAKEGIGDGLDQASVLVLDASHQIVPYLSGELEQSGGIDVDLNAEIAHVFYDTVYAARLHQHPEFNYQGGRRGKFLSSPMMGARKKVLGMFGKALKIRFSRRR